MESHLSTVSFFFPGLDRRGAISLLRTRGRPGSYLLRESSSVVGSFVLSFRVDPFVRNFTVTLQGEKCRIGGHVFPDLNALVAFYSSHPLSDGVCLLSPVAKEECGSFVFEQPMFSPPRVNDGANLRHLCTRTATPLSPQRLATTHSTRIRTYDFPAAARPKDTTGTPRMAKSKSLESANTASSPELRRKSGADSSNGYDPRRTSLPSLSPDSDSLEETLQLPESIDDALSKPPWRDAFMNYLSDMTDEHNVYFLDSVKQYRASLSRFGHTDADLLRAQSLARDLFVKYMTPASMYEVDLPLGTVRDVRQSIDNSVNISDVSKRFDSLLTAFDVAYDTIHIWLASNSWPAFLTTVNSRST